MNLIELLDRREAEAQKIARARGSALMWNGCYAVGHEDRVIADLIVKAGLKLVDA